jgi:hypothetical protein
VSFTLKLFEKEKQDLEANQAWSEQRSRGGNNLNLLTRTIYTPATNAG